MNRLPLLILGLCLACGDVIEPARVVQGEVSSEAKAIQALDSEGIERGSASVDGAGHFTLVLPIGGPYELQLFKGGTWLGTLNAAPQLCAEGDTVELGSLSSCSADCVRALDLCEPSCTPELSDCSCEARYDSEACVETCLSCAPRRGDCAPRTLRFGCEEDS